MTAPRVVAVVQHKGGSGKTTTAVNLAAALAERGGRVLLVDADAQGTLTRWAGALPSDALAAAALGSGELAAAVVPSRWPGVDVAPSSGALDDAALALRPLALTALRAALAALPERWAWIILDTPPTAGRVGLAAILAASWAVVPVEASAPALAGVPSVVAALEDAGRLLPPAARLAGILATRYDGRTVAGRLALDALRGAHGGAVMAATVRETVRHREAAALGRTILEHDPAGAGAADYRAAALELSERIGA